MNRASKKIISETSKNSTVGIDSPVENPPEVGHSSIDAFYQRMCQRDIYLHVSEVSVAMIGVCLTGVSILNVDQDIKDINTYVDNLLAIDAFVFLTAYLLSYWVVRVMTKNDHNVQKIGNIANVIFLIGMIFMAIVCGCIVLQGDYSSGIAATK